MSKLTESLAAQGLIGPKQAETPDTRIETDQGTMHAVDADTLKDPITGEKYRLLGYDAREVDKTVYDDETGEPLGVKSGDVGGAEQTKLIRHLAKEQGFNKLATDGTRDAYGRVLAGLQDEHGQNFGDRLVAEGVVKPSLKSDRHQEQAKWSAFSQLARKARKDTGQKPTEFDRAADWIDEFIAEQSGDPQFRIKATTEAELAAAHEAGKTDPFFRNPYTKSGVQIRSGDRYLNNKAKNPLSVAFDQGLNGAWEGLYGFMELVGHESGFEGLENYAEGKKLEAQYDISNMPSILIDYKEVDSIGDAVQYVGNLGALSLPYMVLTIGAAALAPATGGLSLSAPASVYAGQVWNEMGDTDEGEKSATLAIGAGISMAVLDRLGIAGLANTSLLSSAGRNQIIEELVKKGATREAAEQQLIGASRRATAEFSGEAAGFAKQQLTKRNIIRSVLANTAVNATQEGLTEVGQEAIAYLAAVAGSDKEFNEDELLERLIEAGIGGTVLGGAFSAPVSTYDIGAWHAVAGDVSLFDAGNQERQSRWAQQEVDANGRVRSIEEVVAEARDQKPSGATLQQRAATEEKRANDAGIKDNLGEAVRKIPALWRGATRFIFSPELQDKSKAARELASIFGGSLDTYLSGKTFETARHLKLAEYKNLLDLPRNVARDFGFDTPNRKNQAAASKIIYDAYAAVEKTKDGRPLWSSLQGTEYEQHIPALKKFNEATSRFTDRLWLDQKNHNPDLGRVEAYAYKHRALDKGKIEKNRGQFELDLQNRFGLTAQKSRDLVEAILYSDSVNTVDEAYSVLDGKGYKPQSHRERNLGLSEDPEFAAAWMDSNVFNNLSEMAKSAARYGAYQEYVGQDNSVLNNKLNQMQVELEQAGTPKAEATRIVNRTALGMRNYFDAESGNYKRPQTDAGRKFQAIQRQIMFVTTLAGLPLATLASIVEFALVFKGLNKQQIFGTLNQTGHEFAHQLANFHHDDTHETTGRRNLKELGYMEWEVGAATVVGATETNNRHRQILDDFFKWIGLKQWTDYTRALRGSIAVDYISDKIDILDTIDGPVTNEQQEARDALRNLGINVEDMIPIWEKMKSGPLDENEHALYTDQMRNATFNWINDAIVLPQSANRPLIYQDPRFSLFTQFQGFIATFTANQLPKLYRQAFKGKTPTMKYNAFAVMTTMLMLGFASQYLKDLIKYGGTTPYLDDAEKLQRAVNSSGLLGTGERITELVNPLYEQRYDTSLEWFFGTVAGESAAVTNTLRAGDAAGEVLQGDFEAGYRKGAKLFPVVGPITQAHKEVAHWAFGGE